MGSSEKPGEKNKYPDEITSLSKGASKEDGVIDLARKELKKAKVIRVSGYRPESKTISVRERLSLRPEFSADRQACTVSCAGGLFSPDDLAGFSSIERHEGTRAHSQPLMRMC